MRDSRSRRLWRDPFVRILAGLVLGLVCGVFFGELAAPLKVVGDAYIRLLQMTVLPFVMVALIGGIGRLDPAGAGRIGRGAAILIVFLWIVSWLTVLTIPLSYPPWQSGSFFSSALATGPTEYDPLDIFIPANIFESLTQSVVPAVVVFSIALGLALIAMRTKDQVLGMLFVLETALGRIASFVVRLAPLGIFAIAAEAAGTLYVEEIGRAQVYLGTYVAAWAILSFWTLPVLVAAATPFTYGEVLRCARTAMLTAFATNTVLVVLPMIAEECKKLLEDDGLANEETESTVDVLVPTAYTLPTAGTPISLAFVLFAAWFAGSPLGIEQYPSFSVLGFLSSFGGMYLALPYLLDFFQLRADLFYLFVVGTFATSQLWSSLAAMHGVALCLLGACAVTGQIRWARLGLAAAVSLVVSVVAFWCLGFAFDDLVPDQDEGESRLLSLQISGPQVAVAYPSVPLPLSRRDSGRDRLAVIRERGVLKVGFVEDTPPFIHRNVHDEIVGLDMDLLHSLAGDLGVGLAVLQVGEFASDYWLDVGGVDILVGGIAMTPERALSAAFSRPYLSETPAFIMPDHQRSAFRSLELVVEAPDLRIAIPKRFQFPAIRQYLPNATFVDIQSPKQYLRGQVTGVDAMLYSAEVGSAWTLLYPEFSVSVPADLEVTVPTAWLLSVDSGHLINFVNSWIEVHKDLGLIERKYRHWILGRGEAKRDGPRWSVIRDVLHLVE